MIAMAELHQVLAVDKDLEAAAKKIINETIVVFSKKGDNFAGHHKTLEMFDEARTQEAEGLEEHKEIVTTVPKRLNYTADFIAKHLDCLMQKESTNQHACADITIGNEVIATNVPATMLLGLERELSKLRSVYDSIPTLAPGIAWIPATQLGEGIYRAARPRKTQRTEKTMKVITLAKATKEHKEQVTTNNVDEVVGQWTTEVWSGLVSPAIKADMMNRLDSLIQAVKKARAEANKQEVMNITIGKEIMDYIHKPIS